MLTFHDLACAKGERLLFKGVHCTLERGAWLHVSGANGIGKTSLLRLLCGLSPPATGEIRWDGTPIRTLGDAWRRQLLYIGHDSGLQAVQAVRAFHGLEDLGRVQHQGKGVRDEVLGLHVSSPVNRGSRCMDCRDRGGFR